MDIQKYSREQIQSYSYPITEHFDYSSITSALEVLLSIDSLSQALLSSEPHSIKLSFKVKKLAQSFKSSSDPFASFFSYLPPALKQDLTPWQVISTFVEDFNSEVQDFSFGLHFVSVSKLLAHTGRPQEVFEKELGQKKVRISVFELVWDVDATMENVTKVVKCIPGNLQCQGFLEVAGIVSCGGCYYTSACKVQENWKFFDKFVDKDPVSWVKIAWYLVSGNRYPNLLAYHRVEGYKTTANFITSLDFENLLKFSKKQDTLFKQRARNTENLSTPKPQEKPPLKPNFQRPDSEDPDQIRKSLTPLTRKYDLSDLKPDFKPSYNPRAKEEIKPVLRKSEQVSPRNKEDSIRSWDRSEEMERIYLGTPKEGSQPRSFSRQDEVVSKFSYTPQRGEMREAPKFSQFSPKDLEKHAENPSPYFRDKNLAGYAKDLGFKSRGEVEERGEAINRDDLQSVEYKSGYRASDSAKKDLKFRPSFENFTKEDLGPRKDQDDSMKQPKHFESLLEKYKVDPGKGFRDNAANEELRPEPGYSRDFKFSDRWKSELGKKVLEAKDEGFKWRPDSENFAKAEENQDSRFKGRNEEENRPEDRFAGLDRFRSRNEEESRPEDRFGDLDRFRSRNEEDLRQGDAGRFQLKVEKVENEEGFKFRDEENERFRFRPDDKNDELDRFRGKNGFEDKTDEKKEVRGKYEGLADLERFKGRNEEFLADLERLKGRNQEMDLEKFKYRNEGELDRFKARKGEDGELERFKPIKNEESGLERFKGRNEESLGDLEKFKSRQERFAPKNEELADNRFVIKNEEKGENDRFADIQRFRTNPEERFSEFDKFKSPDEKDRFRRPEEKPDLVDRYRFEDQQDRFKFNPDEKLDRFRSNLEEKPDLDRFKFKSEEKFDFRSELKAQDLSLKEDPEKPSSRQFRSFDTNEPRYKLDVSEDQQKLEEIRSRLYKPDSPKSVPKDYESRTPQTQGLKKPEENLAKFRMADLNRDEGSDLNEWSCAKCGKKVSGTSYECSECRLINWDQFYKVKSLQHSRGRGEEKGGEREEGVKRYSFGDKKEEEVQDWVCAGCGTTNKSLFFLCKGCRKPKTHGEGQKRV